MHLLRSGERMDKVVDLILNNLERRGEQKADIGVQEGLLNTYAQLGVVLEGLLCSSTDY